MIMETVSISEMSVNFYETTWGNIPEDIRVEKYGPFSSPGLSYLQTDINPLKFQRVMVIVMNAWKRYTSFSLNLTNNCNW
jgi:hypothetical protein